MIRPLHHAQFPVELLRERKQEPVTVVLPTREVADTIGPIVERLLSLEGLIDQVLVVDAGSQDGTAEIAASLGAEVHQEAQLLPEFGQVLGKGDAMWRALRATAGEIVVFMDADTVDPHGRQLASLLAPLFAEPALELVKGVARSGDGERSGGGAVTELLARPLLNLHRPELAGFDQPLAGEVAARRTLLERLAFPVGDGVEIAMLLDAAELVGVDALAQADLGARRSRAHRPDEASLRAYAVLVAATRRLLGPDAAEALAPGPYLLPGGPVSDVRQVPVEERPPLVEARAAALRVSR